MARCPRHTAPRMGAGTTEIQTRYRCRILRGLRVGSQTEELIRLQPLNNTYPPVVVPRERVAGLYSGVSVVRSLKGR